MNKIKQHIPGYVAGVKRRVAEFETLEQLLDIPWVKLMKDRPGFHRFSLSGDRLMAEFQQGRLWFVVGYLDEPVEGLPVWK